MELLSFSILAIGSGLCVWAWTLIARALAERAEIRAARRHARLAAVRTDTPKATADAPTDPPAGRRLNPRRNRAVFVLAPVALALGLAVCWVALGIGRIGDVLPWVKTIGVSAVLLAIAQLQVSAALACVGWWFDPARNRRRCPTCWYDLTATASRLCPECGHEPSSERALFRTRRKRGMLWASAALALATYITLKTPAALRYGFFAYVPTSLLVATFEHWPSELIEGPTATVPSPNDASLANRQLNRELFEWQEQWLAYRRVRVALTAKDTRTLHRCLFMLASGRGDELPIKPQFTPAVMEQLFRSLGSADPQSRQQAFQILWNTRDWSSPRVDPSASSWVEPASRTAGELLDSLVDPDPEIAFMAASIVSRSRHLPELPMDKMIALIRADTTPRRRDSTYRLLGLAMLGRGSQAAADFVRVCANDPDPLVRAASVIAVSELCLMNPEHLGRLREMLQDPADIVASRAARRLATFDQSEEFLLDLVTQAQSRQASQDAFLEVVGEVCRSQASGTSTPMPRRIAERLAAIVRDPNQYGFVRFRAAELLADMPDGHADLASSLEVLADEHVLSSVDQDMLADSIHRMKNAARTADALSVPPGSVR